MDNNFNEVKRNRHYDKLPREPRVANKYNLLLSDIETLKIADRNKFNQPPFKRGDGYFFISDSTQNGVNDEDYSGYIIKFYDEPLSGCEISVECFCDGGRGAYFFEQFYKKVKLIQDLEMHEKLLTCINWLLDDKIIALPGNFVSGKNRTSFDKKMCR